MASFEQAVRFTPRWVSRGQNQTIDYSHRSKKDQNKPKPWILHGRNKPVNNRLRLAAPSADRVAAGTA